MSQARRRGRPAKVDQLTEVDSCTSSAYDREDATLDHGIYLSQDHRRMRIEAMDCLPKRCKILPKDLEDPLSKWLPAQPSINDFASGVGTGWNDISQFYYDD